MRRVNLGSKVAGALFLHSMPGRWEPLADFLQEAEARGLDGVVCLTSRAEMWVTSPAYAQAVEQGRFPFARVELAIPDFSVPEDAREFWRTAGEIAGRLQQGEKWMVHCAAGLGRTGTMATAVLMQLGWSRDGARQAVRQAGSNPQTEEQWALLAQQIADSGPKGG